MYVFLYIHRLSNFHFFHEFRKKNEKKENFSGFSSCCLLQTHSKRWREVEHAAEDGEKSTYIFQGIFRPWLESQRGIKDSFSAALLTPDVKSARLGWIKSNINKLRLCSRKFETRATEKWWICETREMSVDQCFVLFLMCLRWFIWDRHLFYLSDKIFLKNT